MKFIAQYIKGKKDDKDVLQFCLSPETPAEKALLGSAYMLGVPADITNDGENLELNFRP